MGSVRTSHRALRSALCSLLAVAVCAFHLPAEAAPKRSSAYHQRDAARLYQAGKYLEAVEALKQAREKDDDPTIVFNIARSYEQAAQLPEALEHYQLYLDIGDDDALVRRSQLAVDRIGALLVKQTESDLERKRLEEEKARAELEAERQAKEREQLELAELQARQQREANAKTGAFVAGGVAVAGLGTGLAFGLMALGSKGEFGRAPTVDLKRNLEGTVKTQALIADIGVGVGLAAAVTAYFLYPKRDAPPKFDDGPSAQLLIGPGAAGVEVKF